jgi:hypothetical protein
LTGSKTIKERETEHRRGKRRYIERLVQEEEANQEIEGYVPDSVDFPDREDDNSHPN